MGINLLPSEQIPSINVINILPPRATLDDIYFLPRKSYVRFVLFGLIAIGH